MDERVEALKAKLLQATALVKALMPSPARRTGRSAETEHDYLRLGQLLLRRAKSHPNGLVGAVTDTRRPTTFQKRLAALAFTLQKHHLELLDRIIRPVEPLLLDSLIESAEQLLGDLKALQVLRQQGLCGPRARRRSKRQALSGLPADWRERLCQRGREGRYGAALLVAALTGCRPSELVAGVRVWRAQDAASQEAALHLEVRGAKVKREQGQPLRRLTYAASDPHPLLQMLMALAPATPDAPLVVQVESAGNFSAEVQRLAAYLWPSHPQAVTGYCLRHQWSADAKRNGDVSSVSRGLGHLSGKTQRRYGTAAQGSKAHRLKPLRIEAERPVKGTAPDVAPTDPDEPESAS
jgi:integrase